VIPTERHIKYFPPKGEIRERVSLLQNQLLQLEISAAWIEHITDLFYYTGSVQDAVFLVPQSGEPLYLVRKSLSRAVKESPWAAFPFPGRTKLIEEAYHLTSKYFPKKLGMALDVTPANNYLRLASHSSNVEIVDISSVLRNQRAIKSLWEIAQIAAATDQATIVFAEMPNFLRSGITELEFSAAVESRLRRLGHGGPLRIRGMGQELAIIMAVSGESASYPTRFDGPVGGEGPYPFVAMGAGQKIIQPGETVMTDMVTLYNGYHSDNARTFYMGSNIPKEAASAHAFCLDFLQMIVENLKPGRTCSDVFQSSDQWAKQHGEPVGFMGYGENRVKFFGHGVGLELDELPVIANKNETELKPGMIIAVEPKVFLPDIGPTGVENTYVITETGCKSLCSFNMQIGIIF